MNGVQAPATLGRMPRDTLTRDQIVTAAIGLLDAEGLEGLNMRALGTRLGSAATAVTVNISVTDALKSRITMDAPLFVFARDPDKPGPPLAAKRLTGAAIGTQVRLTSADSLMPGRRLVSGQRVSIMARVSFSGQPTQSAGDLYGELSYEVGHDGVLDLVIDHVAE